jgi:hypothetical protein
MRRAACLLAATALASLALAGAVLAVPPGPPPKVSGVAVAPPPAWAESGSRAVWAAFGSYCWKTACVDMLPPAGRPDLPGLRARAGSLVRLHLGFVPRGPIVTIGARRVTATIAGRVVAWRARAGIADVRVKGPGGSASYLVRLR